ncbi:MAG: MSHA biogenesis protein MshE, partial [Gammaproteobacteria bacterium]|nr:MSHA biogenesis protein MshE [Gammaproteobacteria bacterium]
MTAPMRRMKIRLGDLLVDKKLISEAQLQEALAEQKRSGRKIGQLLIENGYIQEDVMLQTLSAQIKVPYVDISTFELNPELVQRLPETAARRYRSLVLKETPD